jgi:hypothetical protein
LQSKRKVRKKGPKDEQLQLLRQILAELQRLNANLAAGNIARQPAIERSDIDSGDDEELEDYE